LEEEREAKDEKGYERFSLSHFVLPSPKITRVENRPQKRMGRKLEIKTLIGWLWIKDAFAQLSASYPHPVFDLGFLESTEAQVDSLLCCDHFCRARAEYAPPATHARLHHLIVERRSDRLRAPLHHLEPEVGDVRCIDRANLPQFDPFRVETRKEPGAVTEQYGDELDLHLV
jgi:hypothetical protein